ncbi:hypothetical protein LCGC14_1730870 [marine sediment metagenome]|uniref:Phage ABA sandwich domain-containing protein n=1 Tax=marine sediment metagenome TaxID=412755 RepID=A0A0F9H9D4_9ZZZZ
MPDLTQQDKDELARFAGGVSKHGYYKGECWVFHDGVFNPDGISVGASHFTWISKSDWSPATKPEHGDLVLRALVKAMAKKHKMSILWGWQKVLADLVNETWNLDKRFDFWPAVCAAALELIRQNKQEGA